MAPPDVLGAAESSPPLKEKSNGNSTTTATTSSSLPPSTTSSPDCQFMIAGGGIVGLVLALCLEKDLGIVPHVYEQADAYSFEIGAGMGCYPNGLRVLRHIDPQLLARVQAAGYPYLCRRYERHDGTPVVDAQEEKLGDDTLQSIGIRRSRLQQALYQAACARRIPIHFGKRIATVQDEGNTVHVTFEDGTSSQTEFLFATDGARSQVRAQVVEWKDPEHTSCRAGEVVEKKEIPAVSPSPEDPAAPNEADSADESPKFKNNNAPKGTEMNATIQLLPSQSPTKKVEETPKLHYTGVTCLMGIANTARPQRGICFPSSLTSKFHAVFFPTGENEQCFQLHAPVDEQKAVETWGALSMEEARKECRAWAEQLRADGWHEDYLKPLEHVTRAVRIGSALLQPRLKQWVYGSQRRIVLLGDAAHPPVPYLGQGAQMGLEDAGTLSLLMKHLCIDIDGKFQTPNFGAVTKIFQHMRIPRTRMILDKSKFWGKVQQQRAENDVRSHARETLIKRDIFFNEGMSILFPGATYDFSEAVEQELAKKAVPLAMVSEEGQGTA
eukprot:scaffold10856_cov229-Amphora_coffeaeformis.AAC.32